MDAKHNVFYDHVRQGDLQAVKTFLNSGLLLDTGCVQDVTESPLHIAITENNEQMVDLLLEHNQFVMATNLYGETSLHLACRCGKIDIVKKLLDSGADINYKDCGECTPLFHAVIGNQTHIVKFLIKAGCDLDTLNEELITPLDQAVLDNRTEIISLLLKGGCAIDKLEGFIYYRDHYANSLLYSLWSNDDMDNIRLLVDCGYTTRFTLIRALKLLNTLKQLSWQYDSSLQVLEQMISQPPCLTNLSRMCVRRVFHERRMHLGGSVEDMVNKLDIPEKLKKYLALDEAQS